MNGHPPPAPPPPRRIVVLLTTTAVLKQTASIFFTHNNFLMFLLLSIVLSFQRLNIDLATNTLTSYIDNQSSIKSFFSPTHEPPNPTTITALRRPFFQLPRVGTPEDDFFTEDDEFDRRSLPNPQSNATSFILDSSDSQLGFSNSVSDNDITASEINDSVSIDETAESESDSQSFLKTFDLERHGFTALFIPFGAFYAWYGYLVLGFVSTYANIHGVIFISVLNDVCMRHNSFIRTYLNGCSLGLKRSTRIILMRWVVRSLFSLLIGIWFFGEIEDKLTLVKIFVRLIFMPYSIFSPWVKGFTKEREDFILPWLFVDFLSSFVLTLDPWIVMADPRRNWREVVQEGWNLLSLMLHPAYNLKSLESIVCGPYARWVLARTFGDFFARALQCFMEVYFMVAWMMYYLSVKSIDANSRGQPFGQRELEVMLGDVR